MLTEWSVEGFKSIRSAPNIPLRPINVFAGANSSGKSSLLQSILLLKQTVQYGASNRALALNGPILRLGTLDDVLFAGSDSKQLTIGFCFDVPARGSVFGPAWLDALSRSYHSEGGLKQVSGKFSWTPKLTASHQGSTVERLQSTLQKALFCAHRSSKEGDPTTLFSANYTPTDKSSSGLYSVNLDKFSTSDVTSGKPDAKITGLALSHFLPSWVQIRYNAAKQRLQDLTEALFAPPTIGRSLSVYQQPVPDIARTVINQWLAEHGESPLDSNPALTVSDVNERFQPYIYRRRTTAQANLFASQIEFRTLQETVIQALSDEVTSGAEDWADGIEMPRSLAQGAEFLKAYLKTGVRYLGPLRDEPRPVYPLEALENTTDVGYRGEHTAAVLELNASTPVRYVPAQSFKDDKPNFREVTRPLKAAVNDWLAYMGVAEDVVAREEGVFGNRLQVTTPGLSKFHDLTNVGVGVSQVLPIVVSALLAPKTSLLIFEQPELHLHPRVQARLADFFLAIAKSGRQCILETHSEYLIERFRRRIAESEEHGIEDVLAIYFSEREQGETIFRSVPVTKYGSIVDWPRDFFDQSQIETSRILEAAARKRAREKTVRE